MDKILDKSFPKYGKDMDNTCYVFKICSPTKDFLYWKVNSIIVKLISWKIKYVYLGSFRKKQLPK